MPFLTKVVLILFGFSSDIANLLDGCISVLLLIPFLSVGARRLHDIGKSGWWQLIAFTVVGVFLLFFWFVQTTKPAGDRYNV